MIEEKLGIILVTYNRAHDLEHTFKQLINSPFAGCKIKVLDNCSTDETPNICAKYQKLFPEMIIIRHKRNIGGNLNILRAVEHAEFIYTWILCDDDFYDFTSCSDVKYAIESEKYDLISPGSPGEYEWERGLSTHVKDLINRGAIFFYVRTFVPGIIFKTELFDTLSVHQGYANAHNFFPLFPFINKSFENNFSIYVSKNIIVRNGTQNPASYSHLSFLAGWINSCLMIKDKKVRKKAIYGESNNNSLLKRIFHAILLQKAKSEKNTFRDAFLIIHDLSMAFGLSVDVLIILLIFPMMIIPRFVSKFVLKTYLYAKYTIQGKDIPHDWTEDLSKTRTIDPLRKF
jgi:glycosyltransferase involved in cell wall biosynthesis